MVAQLVEQYTFNVWALGSSPSQITKTFPLNREGFLFMPCVYIIYSVKLNKFYVGACTDLERRLYEHNIGHSKFTATGTPWVLKYKEEFPSLQEAKKRETYIKKQKSRIFIQNLINAQR